MSWKRSDLERVAVPRLAARNKLAPVEKAALAYARWQGLTDESGIDEEAAKLALDEALVELDGLDIEAWWGLSRLADDLGDTAIIGLMQHSLARGVAKGREATRDADNEDDVSGTAAAPGPAKTRRRDKDR